MVATSVFIPYEIYDLTVKITWLRLLAFGVNLLLVFYLVWSKRLLGVRGGKKAYDAALRSESVIEVEQAALAAASPGPPGLWQARLRLAVVKAVLTAPTLPLVPSGAISPSPDSASLQ